MQGLYHPWLHEHDHEHLHYVEGGDLGDSMPALNDDSEDKNEEDEDH